VRDGGGEGGVGMEVGWRFEWVWVLERWVSFGMKSLVVRNFGRLEPKYDF